MKATNLIRALTLASVLASPLANAFDLTGIGFVQYGDAQSYSLPIANLQVGDSNNPGSAFYVNSTPGAIQDLIVVATGASGTNVTTNTQPGLDNAYATPSGVSGSIYWDTTNGAAYNGTGIANQSANTWDASLLALKNFLGGEAMTIFFNNNQTSSGGAATQSLAAWAQLTITDAAGTVVGKYDFLNQGQNRPGLNPYAITPQGGGVFMGDVGTYTSPAGYTAPVAGTNAATDYVLSGGAVCVAVNGSTPPIPVPCTITTQSDLNTYLAGIGVSPTGWSLYAHNPINHDLGANQAAYAILFPELNAYMTALFGSLSDAALAGYTLHADIRLGCDPSITGAAIDTICTGNDPTVPDRRSLNNGYEQIFIGKASTVVNVPEPNMLALLGLGVLALAVTSRKKT